MQASKVFFSVCRELDDEPVRLPGPPAACQRGPAAGVLLHKQLHQLLGLDLLQGSARKVREDLHPPDIVQRAHVPADAVQQTPGDIGRALQLQKNSPLFQVQLCMLNRRLCQKLMQRHGRRVLRKHL